MKHLKQLLFIAVMLMTITPAYAEEGKGEGGVDLQAILWGHVKDSYEWHVTDIGDTKVIIHLPVIVYGKINYNDYCLKNKIDKGRNYHYYRENGYYNYNNAMKNYRGKQNQGNRYGFNGKY